MTQHKTRARKVLRLRQLRRSREMTQAELSRLVGVGVSYISSIEKGRTQPSLAKALDIAAIFSESVESVFSYVEVAS